MNNKKTSTSRCEITKHTFEKPNLDTHEAAALLNVSAHTLRRSRSTGVLLGVKAPEYVKRGRDVSYRTPTLMKWDSQFTERANTAA